MPPLPLNDRRWSELAARCGSASFVPTALAHLLEQPGDLEAFDKLSAELTCENTTWSAAYAAAPYIVEIARRLSPVERLKHMIIVGYMAYSECPESGEAFEKPDYVAEGYEEALRECLPILAETLTCRHNAEETRYLLASVAALKGDRNLGEVLEGLDCGCPHCGEEILKPTKG
jgi:hypothetical protein